MSEFDKIVGYNDVKKELVRICDVIKNSEKYQTLGVVPLAGKAATEIVFGEVDTGANRDLNRAFDIVSRFVDDYCSYGFGYWESLSSSPTRLNRREDRITAEMEKYYTAAKKLLMENKIFLDNIAKRLQQKDTIVYSEISQIKQQSLAVT